MAASLWLAEKEWRQHSTSLTAKLFQVELITHLFKTYEFNEGNEPTFAS